MRFILFVIDSESNSASGNEIAEIDAFNSTLQSDGHWIMAAGLACPSKAKIVDNRGGAAIVNPDSLNNGPEHYSGFWLINADSPEIALSLCMSASKACNRKVELRPFLQ